MSKRIVFPIFILVFLSSACTLASPITLTRTPSSGIEGHVTEGPMCPGPVAIGDNSCPDKPYQATLSILGSNNKEVTRFQTDPSGYFKINIAPGTYILHPESDMALPHASDQTFVVQPDQFTQVTVIFDTGMR
jgi:hypothetical protein